MLRDLDVAQREGVVVREDGGGRGVTVFFLNGPGRRGVGDSAGPAGRSHVGTVTVTVTRCGNKGADVYIHHRSGAELYTGTNVTRRFNKKGMIYKVALQLAESKKGRPTSTAALALYKLDPAAARRAHVGPCARRRIHRRVSLVCA